MRLETASGDRVMATPQTIAGAGGGRFFGETRVVLICLFIALGQFQYGYDSAAIAGFQSMPGFLMIFGYEDVSLQSPRKTASRRTKALTDGTA
jgi:hypothetical protein